MAKFTNCSLSLVSAVLTLMLFVDEGQGQNWGQKVKCFVLQGTVVCPGCNMRSGLFCPRQPEDKPEFDSCEEPTTIPTTTPEPEKETTTEAVQYTTEMEDSEIRKTHLLLYMYRYMGPRLPYRRWVRSVGNSVDNENGSNTDNDDDTCRWNGDCPCPLICCPRGRGCPMRCVTGIRLPPHIYPYPG